jgi:hypothetical protein
MRHLANIEARSVSIEHADECGCGERHKYGCLHIQQVFVSGLRAHISSVAKYLNLNEVCGKSVVSLRDKLARVVSFPRATLSASVHAVCQRNDFRHSAVISYPWLNAKLATASQLGGSTCDQWSIPGGANGGRHTLGRVGEIRSSWPCRNGTLLMGPAECPVLDRVRNPVGRCRTIGEAEMCCSLHPGSAALHSLATHDMMRYIRI